MPDNDVLLQLIQQDPADDYFDNQNTPAREQAPAIVQAALTEALKKFNANQDKKDAQWGKHNKLYINHLMNIDPFCRSGIVASGNPDAINALSRNWGPGWRMIVELGDRPKAYGIYAGGQSGDV